MKNFCSGLFILALFLQASAVFAQKKIYMSDAVIRTADQIDFAYKSTVKKAVAKDGQAIIKLIEFSRILDGVEAVEHARTMLEIIPAATDKTVAVAIQSLSPKLKKVTLDRMLGAQKNIKNEALKKPIKNWAPLTWETLNNRPLVLNDPASDQKMIDRDNTPTAGPKENMPEQQWDESPAKAKKTATPGQTPNSGQPAKHQKGGH